MKQAPATVAETTALTAKIIRIAQTKLASRKPTAAGSPKSPNESDRKKSRLQ
jgi:hypothetical protein